MTLSYNNKSIISTNQFLFIYMDIISDQYVGDTESKCLETVTLQGKRGQTVSNTISNPHYVNVAKTNISSINIVIKDSLGENIHFDLLSRVVVKLHFRQKRYE